MKLTKEQWKIAITLFIIGSFVYLDKNLISMTVMVLSEQNHWLPTQTGIIFSIYYIGFIIITIPSGWIVDRFGYKKFVVISIFIVALFSILFSFMSSLTLLALMRLGVGIGHAGYTNSTPKIIGENYIGKQRASVQSKILATIGVGGILAYTVGIQLVNYNWRITYWIIALLFILTMIMIIFIIPEKRAKLPTEKAIEKISLFTAWKNKNVLIFSLGMLFINLVNIGMLSWLPIVLKENFNLTNNTTIGYILTFNAIIMAISSMTAGVLMLKVFSNREKKLITISAILGAICLILFIVSTNLVITISLLYLITIFTMLAFTTMLTLPYKFISNSIIGSAFAVINIGAFIGGTISPIIIGYLVTASNGSFFTGYLVMAFCLFLAGLTPFLIKEKVKTVA